MDDYRTWSDAALDELSMAISDEQERRANLAAIPDQIKELAKAFRDGGGNEHELQDALTPEQLAELKRNAG